MADKKDNSKILKQVCHLCRQKDFKAARALILEVAGISPEEQAKISSGEMSRYIMQKSKNPNIQRMIQIENAFYDLSLLAQEGEDPSALEAKSCIDKLDEVMPLLNQEDKLYVKYWQSYYYRYVYPDNDAPRYALLLEVIQKTPKNRENSDEIYMSCARQIEGFAVSTAERYEAIKLAQTKTSENHPINQSYKEMLSKLALNYYNILLQQTSSQTNTYSQRKEGYLKALKVVDDFNLQEERKNAYKLYLYSQLIPLQKQNNDKDIYTSYRAQQNLIFKQARLQKRLGIYNYKRMNSYL